MWDWTEGQGNLSKGMEFELVLTSVRASVKQKSPSVVKSPRELINKQPQQQTSLAILWLHPRVWVEAQTPVLF